MKKDLSYCIVLSSEQLSYLAESKYGIDRMKILNRLIEATVLEHGVFQERLCHDIASRTGSLVRSGIVLQIGLRQENYLTCN